MGNKIGNSEYGVIHFKGQFKDTYNLDNPQIYNMENILAKKDLTTEKSRKNIANLQVTTTVSLFSHYCYTLSTDRLALRSARLVFACHSPPSRLRLSLSSFVRII